MRITVAVPRLNRGQLMVRIAASYLQSEIERLTMFGDAAADEPSAAGWKTDMFERGPCSDAVLHYGHLRGEGLGA